MAIVVESVSAVTTAGSTDTLTITKPTGLSEGDLMVAILCSYAGDGSTNADTFNTLAGWTLAIQTEHATDLTHCIQYKVADTGDMAASNFSFVTNASGDALVGQIIRASGQNTMSALGYSSAKSAPTANSTTFAGTISYTPGADGALVISQIGGDWNTGGTFRTLSDYTTVTSGISLTEGYTGDSTDGSGGVSFGSAYGIQDTAASLTEYGATYANSAIGHYGQFVVFIPPVHASGSNTLATTTSTTFAQTGLCDGVAGNTLVTTTAETFTQDGEGIEPTQWTTTNKS